ncbi:MAG: hypothetical protein ACYDBT_09945 [Desulfobulbaceae bacterium]
MTELEEIKAELRAAKEKVKRLTADVKLVSAMNRVKLDWSTDYLSPEMKEGVQKAAEKYLGPEGGGLFWLRAAHTVLIARGPGIRNGSSFKIDD